ncbi:MAG TPA: hypothetical protein VK809_13425 [Bacteroidia bacterium]|nr:hypothetical protein [Bacteroidia bacterium]
MQEYHSTSPKDRLFLLIGLVSLLFIPFIVLCFYAHPIADDYTYSPVSPFWETQKQLYLHWNGRYSANFMVMANPILHFSLIGYRLAALGLLLSIPISILFAVSCAFRKVITLLERIVLSSILSLFILSLLSSLPEGIYWYPGAMTYILGCCIAIFYMGFVILYQKSNFIGNRWIHFCVCVILLFLAIGFNEVQMLLFIFAHFAGWISLKKQERFNSIFLPLLLFCALFSSVMFFAPGNHGRESFFPNNHNLVYSLGMTALQMPRFFFTWISSAPLWIGSILFAPVSFKLYKESVLFNKLGQIKPLIVFSFLLVILFLCIFPAYWSTAILGQHRTLNTACFFFILTWFLFIHTVYSRNNLAGKMSVALNPTIKTGLGVFLIFTLLFSGNSGTILMDLASGKIRGFDKEMTNRYNLIDAAKKQRKTEIIMQPLQNRPASLFILDIQPGCDHWINQQFAQFYGLKKICCDSAGYRN